MSSEKNYINDQYKSFFEDGLSKTDPDLYKAIRDELNRQYNIRKQDRTTQFDLSDPFMAAGGGIAKMAGVDQGPPPESGPNSQGLQGLMKRVRNL